jgi:hypothetical protein
MSLQHTYTESGSLEFCDFGGMPVIGIAAQFIDKEMTAEAETRAQETNSEPPETPPQDLGRVAITDSLTDSNN